MDCRWVVAGSLPTIHVFLSEGQTHNFGSIFGLIRISIVNPITYSNPSYIIVGGKGFVWLYKGWYLKETDVKINDDYELVVTNSLAAQDFFITKIS